MDFEQFKEQALRTESRPETMNHKGLVLAAVVLGGCTASLLDALKKVAFYGKPLDNANMHLLLADVAGAFEAVAAQLNDPVPDEELFMKDGETGEEVTLAGKKIPMRFAHAAIGAFTESGELLEALLEAISGNGTVDKVNAGEEFADIDWYKAIAFDELGLSEEDTRAAVIAKLKKRYPEKFSTEGALNRDLNTERGALEAHIVSHQ